MTLDYSMLYILVIVVVAVAIACGVKVLKKKNLLDDSDLQLITQIFQLSTDVIEELNLKNETAISKISDIVISALQYANTVSTSKTKDEMIALATEEAYKLCNESGLELNDNRKAIISQLVTLGIGTIIIPETEVVDGTTTPETTNTEVVPETIPEVIPEVNTVPESTPESTVVPEVNTTEEVKTTN